MLVDMSYYDKPQLPQELFNHIHISRLILRGHGIKSLSPAIGQLHNLVQLDLCSYNIKQQDWNTYMDRLPESLCTLHNLVQLDLSFNGLSFLPYSIYQLSSLQYLNLTNNQLKDIPRSLFQMRNLQFLSLRHNNLGHLDGNVGRLRALTHLDVGENELDEIPDRIGECVMISVLLCDSLLITEIPDSVTKIQSLTVLDLSNNLKLEMIPEGFEKLSHLTAVHVPKCLPALHQCRGVRNIQSILVKNKTSDLVDIMCVKQLPIDHEFDVKVKRNVEMVDPDKQFPS